MQVPMGISVFVGVLFLGTFVYADFLHIHKEEDNVFRKNQDESSFFGGDLSLNSIIRKNCVAIQGSDHSMNCCMDGVGYKPPRSRKKVEFSVFGAKYLSEVSALHSAAADGRADVVRDLLDSGVPVDLRTKQVHRNRFQYRDTLLTALHIAAAAGKIGVLSVLLEYGANVSATSEVGDTALHKAALHGQDLAVRWLVQHGADLEAENVFGASPLAMAMVNERQGVVEVLLDHGARRVQGEPQQFQSSPIILMIECTIILIFKFLK